MRRALMTVALALILVLVTLNVAWAQGNGENGLDPNTIVLLLTPLLAAATAVERIIEMLFNWYESTILNSRDLLGTSRGYLRWAQEQVQKWQTAVQWDRLSGEGLRQAEDALEDAEERLVGYLKSPEYTRRKAVGSALLGILLGLLIAFMTQLRMFSLLNINLAWPWVDIFVTGLVVGTGSAPVHSLIGLLQKTKSAIEEARALWSGRAYNQAIEAELKRVGLQSEIQTLRELKQQMEDILAAAKEQEGAPPTVMAVPLEELAEGAPVETRQPEPRTMGSAELDRRVRRILR